MVMLLIGSHLFGMTEDGRWIYSLKYQNSMVVFKLRKPFLWIYFIHILLWHWWIIVFQTYLKIVKNALKKILQIGILRQSMTSTLTKIINCANKKLRKMMIDFLCSSTKGCWFYKRELFKGKIHCCSHRAIGCQDIISWGAKSTYWFSWGWQIYISWW